MYAKIAKWISWVLMIISVVMLVWGFAKGFETNNGAPVDVLLNWAYILLGVAIALVIIIGVIYNGINEPKSLIGLGVGIVLLALVAVIAYAVSSGAPLVNYIGEQPTHTTLKLTDTLLNTTYILGGAAIVAIIAGEIISAVRNK